MNLSNSIFRGLAVVTLVCNLLPAPALARFSRQCPKLRNFLIRNGLAASFLGLTVGVAAAQEYTAQLSGFSVIPPILTSGTGTLVLDVHKNSATYSLTYSGLTVGQAELTFGRPDLGGVGDTILVFLCTNFNNGPAGTPHCPLPGTVTGTITAANIVALPNQNVPAGDFGALLAALGSNTMFVDLKSSPGGFPQIGGQVRLRKDQDQN